MLCVIMLSVSVFMLSVFMLSVVLPSVILPSVVAPFESELVCCPVFLKSNHFLLPLTFATKLFTLVIYERQRLLYSTLTAYTNDLTNFLQSFFLHGCLITQEFRTF